MTRFQELFGREAEGRWSAPGRVNLIGEYTDLNEGHVLPFAIPARTTVHAAARPDRRLRCITWRDNRPMVHELDMASTEMPGDWSAYVLAVAKSLEASGHEVVGADLLVDSTVPVGAGLSSSAALECAVAMALCDLSGARLTPMSMARVAQSAERDFVGMPCGLMDQAAAMCCEEGHALLLDTREGSFEQVPLPLGDRGLELLVVDSRVEHHLQSSSYSERRSACQKAASVLGVRALRDVTDEDVGDVLDTLRTAAGEQVERRARHVLSEQRRVAETVRALRAGDMEAVGALLVEGHRSLRDDFEVSCPELDLIVATAVANGALGARLTGAGFGGSAVVLAPIEAGARIESAVKAEFRNKGWREPTTTVVEPSPGARRDG